MTATEELPNEIRLDIDSLAYGPNGIGRHRGQVILVPGTAPGDRVEIQITETKKNYAIGSVTNLIAPAAVRREAPCPYAGDCGGCQWQHIEYHAQLSAKEKCIDDALRRIGKLDGFEIYPILPSPEEFRYRRRIRLQCDAEKRVGFHRAATHRVVEVDSCLIADAGAEQHIGTARAWVRGLKTKIRYVDIALAESGNTTMLAGKAEGPFHREDQRVCAQVLEDYPQVCRLILSGPGWRHAWDQEARLVPSQSASRAGIDGDVFMQANWQANQRLVDQVMSWGEFGPRDRLLELYCGSGNLTLPMARLTREVVAVERNRRSVERGKKSAQDTGAENIHWVCSDVLKVASRMAKAEKGERFSKIILNPPRTGAKGLEQYLPSLKAGKILYVSCDPPTLARDLRALTGGGYRLSRIQPMDLFPQTFHVEALAELTV